MKRSKPLSILLSAVVLASAVVADGPNQRTYSIRVEGIPSHEHVEPAIRVKALQQAIDDLMMPRAGTAEEQAAETRLRASAERAAERLVQVKFNRGPTEHALHGWWAEASATVEWAKLESLRHGTFQMQAAAPLRVMVLITERVEYVDWPWHNPRFREEEVGSLVAQCIAAELIKGGLQCLDPGQFELLRNKAVNAAELVGEDLRAIQSRANDQGADLLILGHIDVSGPRAVQVTPARTGYLWSTAPKVRIVWSDSAVILDAPIPAPQFREAGGLFRGPAEARTALERVGAELGRLTLRSILQRAPAPGAERELLIAVSGADIVAGRLIAGQLGQVCKNGEPKAQQKIEGVELRIRTDRDPSDLAADLAEVDYGGAFRLKVLETGSGKISMELVR